MNYLLIVFGKSDKQDQFVETLCRDVSVMSDLGDVRYYYGSESVIITFQCSEVMSSVSSFMNLLYSKMNIVYILLPYDKDNLSVQMDKDTSKHLFDIEIQEKNNDKKSDIEGLVQMLFGSSNKLEGEFISESEDDEIDEIEILKSKREKSKEITLDEILDKINSKGISSLSEKELSLLNKYSKI